MKKGLIAVVVVLLLICGLYALRNFRGASASAATVASLLPHDTIALAHLRDFNRTREDWKQSDIYQLYAEPAVQDFLRHPMAREQQGDAAERMREIGQLEIRDLFFGLLPSENDNSPRFVAGFRFHGTEADANKIVARWLPQRGTTATLDYQQHKIETTSGGMFSLNQVYDGQWFFVSNNTDELKLVLDRVDGRVTDKKSLLNANETFRNAMSQMPSDYAVAAYAQPQAFAALFNSWHNGPAPAALANMNAVVATSRFQNHKIHDVIFFAAPNPGTRTKLTRDSLRFASADTFFYAAGLLNFSNGLTAFQPAPGTNAIASFWGKVTAALERGGLTAADWEAAFGAEAGALADWPADAHWPGGVAVFPVNDSGHARKIAVTLAHALDEDATWIESDRNGAHYVAMDAAPGFLTLHPAIAVMDKVMFVGLDLGSVDAAVQRAQSSSSALANSAAFKSATAALPAPTHSFAYLDLALVYSRIDSALRPFLMMGAAFMPAVNNSVDMSRLPSAETVTKHLSPIVTSQRYANGGYIAESVGPITLSDAGLGLLFFGVTQRNLWPGAAALGLPGTSWSQPSHGGWGGKRSRHKNETFKFVACSVN